jgi:hypothetical protein
MLLLEANIRRAPIKTTIVHPGPSDHLAAAITSISKMNFASLVLLVAAIALLTMITQAFEFEAIQLFEGYWGRNPVVNKIAALRCGHYAKKRIHLQSKSDTISDMAFCYAKQKMLDNLSLSTVNLIEAQRKNGKIRASKRRQKAARAIIWEAYARLGDLRRLERLDALLREYPAEHRLLPTRLGNTLRSYEDQVHDPKGRLQWLVTRVFDQLPPALQADLDHYHSRLQLYCSLVIVLVIGGVSGIYFLPGISLKVTGIVITMFLAWLSYRAAITSARAYGGAIIEVGDLEGIAG